MSQQTSRSLDDLQLPSTSPAGFIRHFGPGMILMMTGIGTSHLITAPVAGGRFQYALLWCIPIAYLFKYYGFEMAFRFTHATGRSMLDAYATAWKKWPLWYVMVTTLIQCAIGQAGRLIAAAAVLYYFLVVYLRLQIPALSFGVHIDPASQYVLRLEPLALCALFLGVLCVALILSGKYAMLELVTKVCAGMLVISTLAVYLYQPAPLSSLAHFFIVGTPQHSALPPVAVSTVGLLSAPGQGPFLAASALYPGRTEGSWLIIAAFLGLLPTGIDVSLQASEWGKAKKVGTARIRQQLETLGLAHSFDPLRSKKADLTLDSAKLPTNAREYCRRWFAIGLWDFRLGHFVSFVLACIFLLLAAVWIYPSQVKGTAVMGEIARMFTNVGEWMMLVFLVGAFAATFSTAFNYFDGWPRVVAVCCRNLFRAVAAFPGIATEDLTPERRKTWYSEYNIYRATMIFSLVAGVVLIAGAPRPVWLVLIASALAFFIAPVIFFLNLYYCFTVIPKNDKVFYPSVFVTWFSWISLAVFTVLSGILILARVFQIELS